MFYYNTISGQYHNRFCSFFNGITVFIYQFAHHGSTVKYPEIIRCCSTAKINQGPYRCSYGYFKRHGILYFPVKGYKFFGNAITFQGFRNIKQGLNICHDSPDHQRYSTFRNYPARNFVDQHLFISSRIEITKLEELEINSRTV